MGLDRVVWPPITDHLPLLGVPGICVPTVPDARCGMLSCLFDATYDGTQIEKQSVPHASRPGVLRHGPVT